jgi:hypothetical protein
MVISNQKIKKCRLTRSQPCTSQKQPWAALDAPDYMHRVPPCHINRIDSSHKKID